jgi:hypothetical protein
MAPGEGAATVQEKSEFTSPAPVRCTDASVVPTTNTCVHFSPAAGPSVAVNV